MTGRAIASATVALVALLAACNKGGAGNGVTVANSQPGAPAPPAMAATMQPGRWETIMRVVSIDMPNASPDVAQMLRAQPLPPPQTQFSCVTPEEASDMVGTFRRQIQQSQANQSCEIGDQQFGGGRIRFSMSCRGQNGQSDTRIAIVGNYTGNNVQMAVSANTAMAIGNGTVQAVRAESTMTGRYVGQCNGTETD